jgi:hypothetical protein
MSDRFRTIFHKEKIQERKKPEISLEIQHSYFFTGKKIEQIRVWFTSRLGACGELVRI